MSDSMDSSKPLFPTSYFPPIAMMGAMVRCKEVYIEKKETFPKQTHRNRTKIITANGAMTLSVPLLRPQGTHTTTESIGISYTERWNILHLRAIETAYNSSPFYMYYRDEIEKILLQRYERLIDLNKTILDFVLKKIKIDCTVSYTDEYIRESEAIQDYRGKYDYKHPDSTITIPKYYQVFGDRMPFDGNVGILDALFNLGPETKEYLLRWKKEEV